MWAGQNGGTLKAYRKSIRIFLASGEPTGLRYAELMNTTVQAFVVPRARYTEFRSWREMSAELQRPGVYILTGVDDETGGLKAYVGESENVADRLAQHYSKKDWWREGYLVTSKDANLNKAHVRWLEAKLYAEAENARRAVLEAGQKPCKPILSVPDTAGMDEFCDHVELLVGALGCMVFKPFDSRGRDEAKSEDLVYRFSGRNFDAQAKLVDEGMLLLAGSKLTVSEAGSTPGAAKSTRARLLEEGALRASDDCLLLLRDEAFASPSAAAAVVAGGSRNGRDSWTSPDGRTLKQVEEETANAAKSGASEDVESV